MRLAAAVIVLVGAGSGCGEDCGPGGATADAITITAPSEVGDATGKLDNDLVASRDSQCLNISDSMIQLCVERPGDLQDGLQLGAGVDMLSFYFIDGNCTFTMDPAGPSGSVSGTGVCGDGTDPHGFALAIDATVPLIRKCGAGQRTASVTGQISGRTAVVVN